MIHSMDRRGYTLIEMMAVMSVSATLMLVSVGWIHQSMKIGSVMRQRQHHHQSLLRLARQLRDDVNRGQSMLVAEEQLVITGPQDRRVSYTLEPAGVVRRIDGSNTADHAESRTARGSFNLAPTATARWDTSEMPTWISLVVDRGVAAIGSVPPGASTTPAAKSTPDDASLIPVDLYVRAAVGRRRSGLGSGLGSELESTKGKGP